MAGRFVRDGDDVCFMPRFAFVDGTTYTVVVDGRRTGDVLVRPRPDRAPTTEVLDIRPTATRGAAQPAPALRAVLGADERGLRRRPRPAGRRGRARRWPEHCCPPSTSCGTPTGGG